MDTCVGRLVDIVVEAGGCFLFLVKNSSAENEVLTIQRKRKRVTHSSGEM